MAAIRGSRGNRNSKKDHSKNARPEDDVNARCGYYLSIVRHRSRGVRRWFSNPFENQLFPSQARRNGRTTNHNTDRRTRVENRSSETQNRLRLLSFNGLCVCICFVSVSRRTSSPIIRSSSWCCYIARHLTRTKRNETRSAPTYTAREE